MHNESYKFLSSDYCISANLIYHLSMGDAMIESWKGGGKRCYEDEKDGQTSKE